MELIIRNTRPVGMDADAPVDIAIAGDRIARIAHAIPERADREIDAGGRLVSPPFIEPHIHLDKTQIAGDIPPNRTGTLMGGIEVIWERKRRYTVEDIVARAGRTIEMAVRNGTTRLRTHADVDAIVGLRAVEGLLEVKRRYADLVDMQIIAFPQEGILCDPGTEDLLWQAMDMGADLVGGMPHHEKRPEDWAKHIDVAFRIAKHFDADIDMHVDETDDPAIRSLEVLADKTLNAGYQGRVTAGHTCALAAYPEDYAAEVIRRVKRAGIHMITNPATNLVVQGRGDRGLVRRGVTRVKALMAAGINVAFGQDCVYDGFYPFGTADLLEIALLTAHVAHLSLPGEIEAVFRMPTFNSARIWGLDDYGIREGGAADLVVIDCETPAQAVRFHPPRLWVVRNGRVISESSLKSRIHRSG
ncbi:MAG: amidohydrolase family protein [Nitrospinota bacterium]|nr:amidohydrolase family protein [Nitrospinota bacterium]